MNKYYRLIVAFLVSVAIMVSAMELVNFLLAWLPAKGIQVSPRTSMIVLYVVLAAAIGASVQLCVHEGKKIAKDDKDSRF